MNSVLFDPEFPNHAFKFSPDLLSNFPTHRDFSEEIKIENPNIGFDPESYDSVIVPDFPDACLKFISDILLEEDLEETPSTFLEFNALQATEKALYDALGVGDDYSPSSDSLNLDEGFDSGYVDGDETTFEPPWMLNQVQLNPVLSFHDISQPLSESNSLSSGGSSNSLDDFKSKKKKKKKKTHKRDEGGDEIGRSNKQQASTFEDYVEMKEFDDVLLACIVECVPEKKVSKGKTTRGKKGSVASEDVDLRTILSNCAQAVSGFDFKSARELLRQIRQHSTPYGDSLQRLSHYFANALEARLAGTGSTVYGSINDARISSYGLLKAYKQYVSAVPFKRMSYFLANKTISKLSENATTIHIIDFGVLLGIQWPCLIQVLSKRATGPPRLRITGIDYPQQGFRPSERIDATGRRLEGYCERFNVPFEYQGIVAKSWDDIKLEDLKIEKDELVFVSCMFRSGTLLDETVVAVAESPRDGFLRLIKDINPRLFLHGTINGSLNAPFFITRFREALFHYSSIFDVFEATMSREDHERLVIESEMYGKEVINVIACEGIERIQRPETYKQWQVRATRAGFRQVPLDQELVTKAKAMVKANYHKDFVVDEDRHWMLQGWKGRLFSAFSVWQPRSP